MNIIDALFVIFLLVCILGGLRRGLIKETIMLFGLVIVVVVSWYLRIPVATYMYKHLPFFGFKGMFQGISVLNILLYELIAFLVVFSILSIILTVVIKISGIVEKILKATIILGIFSRIGGAIVGFLEGWLILYLIVFVISQPFITLRYYDDAVTPNIILKYTPVMSTMTKKTRKTIDEIYAVAKKYKDSKKDNKVNKEMIDIFLKYDIITEENLNYLKEKGKIVE